MNVNEFVKILHEEVDEFQRFWIEQSEIDPDNFPSDLTESQWIDQVDAYNSIMMEQDDDQTELA